MTDQPTMTCQRFRPGEAYDGKQGFRYVAGISAESAGSRGICMHLLTIQPGDRAKAHLHEGHETAIYALKGESEMWYGEQLQHHMVVREGEMLYIPAWRAPLADEPVRRPLHGGHRPDGSERAGERRAPSRPRGACAGLREKRRKMALQGKHGSSG